MFCDVGSHLIAANEDEYRCAHCGRRLCSTLHMGNPDALPGEHIACIDHVEEVAAMEAKLRASRMRKQQRHSSTIKKDLMIGSIVHYAYNPSLLGLKGSYTCVPAIITRIFHKKFGNVNLLEFETMDMKSCLYAEEIEPGSWHWPEDHHDD